MKSDEEPLHTPLHPPLPASPGALGREPSASNKPLALDSFKRVALLGASRGLGARLAQQLLTQSTAQLWLSSRKIRELLDQPATSPYRDRLQCIPFDLNQSEQLPALLDQILQFQPTHLIYVAGGGPFGPFHSKPWHAHTWAYTVNLIVPGQILHYFLCQASQSKGVLQQMIFVGSAIAEDKADPGAASYSSAKHGLKGLIQSVVAEGQHGEEWLPNPKETLNKNINKNIKEGLEYGLEYGLEEDPKESLIEPPPQALDIRLYSPGYMDTTLLPPHSRPRQDGSLIAHPENIAHDLLKWASAPRSLVPWHRVFKP